MGKATVQARLSADKGYEAMCVGESNARAPAWAPSWAQSAPQQSRRTLWPSLFGCFQVASTPKKETVEVASASKDPPTTTTTTALKEADTTGQPPYLRPQMGKNIGRKTLVLDLDETLIHSSLDPLDPVPEPDFAFTLDCDGEYHSIYVHKRPGVDEFLAQLAKKFELVVYTASDESYANAVLDQLDPNGLLAFRLFRDACTVRQKGSSLQYIKDLSRLGRNLQSVAIVDNSPTCYSFQPSNAIPIKTWKGDPDDRELQDLLPILGALAAAEDIPAVLRLSQRYAGAAGLLQAPDTHTCRSTSRLGCHLQSKRSQSRARNLVRSLYRR